jgi:hypothetical protein
MRSFLKYSFLLLGFTILIMVLLEIVFTTIYHTGAYRNKIMWVRDMEERTPVDYVILGSSRVNYGLQPKLIEAQTGKIGYNLGMNATNMVETIALLEEFLKIRGTAAVYVQVDIQYGNKTPDPVGEIPWMPFLHDQSIYKHFKEYGDEYRTYRYVPFYRYQKFAARLGAREAIASLLGSGYAYEDSRGYMPLYGKLQEEEYFTPEQSVKVENQLYNELVDYCKENNIELYFFTAPYYRFMGDIEKLETFLPNYINFSDSIQKRAYFSDQVHLNTKGAKLFTEIFIETYFSETE